MTDKEIIEMITMVARYANEYETQDGNMTLRDLMHDAETSCDYPYNEEAEAIRKGVDWK